MLPVQILIDLSWLSPPSLLPFLPSFSPLPAFHVFFLLEYVQFTFLKKFNIGKNGSLLISRFSLIFQSLASVCCRIKKRCLYAKHSTYFAGTRCYRQGLPVSQQGLLTLLKSPSSDSAGLRGQQEMDSLCN